MENIYKINSLLCNNSKHISEKSILYIQNNDVVYKLIKLTDFLIILFLIRIKR